MEMLIYFNFERSSWVDHAFDSSFQKEISCAACEKRL